MMSTLLCVSSDTETVHIFKLSGSANPNNNPTIGRHNSLTRNHLREGYPDGNNSSSNKPGYRSIGSQVFRRSSFHEMVGKKIVGSVGSYLPGMITEIWEPSRDFAFLKLPNVGSQSLVALSNTTPQVLVVTSEGYLYQYNIDLENGGECALLKQYSLLDNSDDNNVAIMN